MVWLSEAELSGCPSPAGEGLPNNRSLCACPTSRRGRDTPRQMVGSSGRRSYLKVLIGRIDRIAELEMLHVMDDRARWPETSVRFSHRDAPVLVQERELVSGISAYGDLCEGVSYAESELIPQVLADIAVLLVVGVRIAGDALRYNELSNPIPPPGVPPAHRSYLAVLLAGTLGLDDGPAQHLAVAIGEKANRRAGALYNGGRRGALACSRSKGYWIAGVSVSAAPDLSPGWRRLSRDGSRRCAWALDGVGVPQALISGADASFGTLEEVGQYMGVVRLANPGFVGGCRSLRRLEGDLGHRAWADGNISL